MRACPMVVKGKESAHSPEKTRHSRSPGSYQRRSKRGTHRLSSGEEPGIPRALLCLLVVIAPQLFGGVFAWATAALAFGACSVLGFTLWQVRDEKGRPAEREPLVLALLLILGVTLLHALPLPISLISGLAPDAVAHASAVATGLGEPTPRWVAYSLDPGSTHERVLFAVAIGSAFCTAAILSARASRTALLTSVVASAGLIAAVHLSHQLLRAERVFGIYAPQPGQMQGPLLNPNNLAGFIALALPLCLGFALNNQRQRFVQGAWLGGAGVLAATALLARSRGGAVVIVGGPLLFAALYLFRTWRRPNVSGAARDSVDVVDQPHGRRRALEIVVLTTVTLGTAGVLAALASRDFVDTDYRNLTKIAMYREELRWLLQSPARILGGVGRGGFSASFSAVQQGSVRFQHAESLPLQYAIEFGLPVAVLLFGAVLVRLWTSLRDWRTPIQLGAIVGVVTLGLQNLVDFSLELTGVALPAAVCLAAGLNGPRYGHATTTSAWDLKRTASLCVALGTVAILTFTPTAIDADLSSLRPQLQAFFREHDTKAFWELFRRGVRAHPADAELAGTAGAKLVGEGDPRATFWLNRAMLLAPGWEVPHLWAAQWLLAHGHGTQGLEELRLAAEIDPKRAGTMLCSWPWLEPTAQNVLRAAPEGANEVPLLDRGAACLPLSEAATVDDVIEQKEPGHVGVRLRRASRALAAGDWNAARTLARSLQAMLPAEVAPYHLEASALLGAGHPSEAVHVLEVAAERVDDRGLLLTVLARTQTNAQDANGMRKTVEQLRAHAAGDTRKLADALDLLSHEEAKLGNGQRALAALRQAYQLTGAPSQLADSARLARQLGDLDYALSAWRELCRKDPTFVEACHQSDAIQRSQAPVD